MPVEIVVSLVGESAPSYSEQVPYFGPRIRIDAAVPDGARRPHVKGPEQSLHDIAGGTAMPLIKNGFLMMIALHSVLVLALMPRLSLRPDCHARGIHRAREIKCAIDAVETGVAEAVVDRPLI